MCSCCSIYCDVKRKFSGIISGNPKFSSEDLCFTRVFFFDISLLQHIYPSCFIFFGIWEDVTSACGCVHSSQRVWQQHPRFLFFSSPISAHLLDTYHHVTEAFNFMADVCLIRVRRERFYDGASVKMRMRVEGGYQRRDGNSRSIRTDGHRLYCTVC